MNMSLVYVREKISSVSYFFLSQGALVEFLGCFNSFKLFV